MTVIYRKGDFQLVDFGGDNMSILDDLRQVMRDTKFITKFKQS